MTTETNTSMTVVSINAERYVLDNVEDALKVMSVFAKAKKLETGFSERSTRIYSYVNPQPLKLEVEHFINSTWRDIIPYEEHLKERELRDSLDSQDGIEEADHE